MHAGAIETQPQAQQLFLPMFMAHEIQAWAQREQQRQSKKEKAVKARSIKSVLLKRDEDTTSLFDLIDDSLLDMPLGGVAEGNELNCDVDPLRADVAEKLEDFVDEHIEWSDAAIEELHEGVLHYSLKLLQAKGNGAEKKEVVRWIFAPKTMVASLHGESGRTVETVLSQPLTPFSFEQCCAICGYSPERLTDGLVPVLKEIGLQSVFKELFDGKHQ